MKKVLVIVMLIIAMGLVGCPRFYQERGPGYENRGHNNDHHNNDHRDNDRREHHR